MNFKEHIGVDTEQTPTICVTCMICREPIETVNNYPHYPMVCDKCKQAVMYMRNLIKLGEIGYE